MSPVRCRGCQKPYNPSFNNCPHCGLARGEEAAHNAAPAGPLKCPSCTRVYNASFAMCPFCGSARPAVMPAGVRESQQVKRPSIPAMAAVRPPSQPNIPPAPPDPNRIEPISADFAEIAEAFLHEVNPYLRYEFTPAVAYGFDVMFDALFTPRGAGVAPRDGMWSPTETQRKIIANIAIFLGELIQRTWGGRWIDEPDSVLTAKLQLPGGKVITPGIQVMMRLRDGALESLIGYFDKLRRGYGQVDLRSESSGWMRLGEFYEREERWEQAVNCYKRAGALLFGPEGDEAREAQERCELLNTRESLVPGEVARASVIPAPIATPSVPPSSAASHPSQPNVAAHPSPPPPAAATTQSVRPPAGSASPAANMLMAEAASLAQRGQIAQAVSAYEQALSFDPTNITILLELPLGLANLGRMADAIAVAERAVNAAPADPRTHDALAVLRASAGQLHGALTAIDAGLQLHPNDLSLLVRRGNFLARGAQYEPARNVLEHALRVDPSHFEARLTYADCLRRMGHRAEALAQLEQALTVSHSQPKPIVDFATALRARWAQEA